MLNHDQKLKYSIGIDSLALLCAKQMYGVEMSWNIHEEVDYAKILKGVSLSIAIKELNSQTTDEVGYIAHEYTKKGLADAKASIGSIFNKIRADLNSSRNKLVIEKIDTHETNSIRVTIESAFIWAMDILEIDISEYFLHALNVDNDQQFEWGVKKTKNNLEYVAAMFDLLRKEYINNDTDTALPKKLIDDILRKCQNEKGADKARSIRNLYDAAKEVATQRIPKT